jgi:hypothetical protein
MKIFLIFAGLVVIITASYGIYGIVTSQDSTDVSAYGEPTYQLQTGEEVDNLAIKDKVDGPAILDPALILDEQKAGNVVSVDYYANGKLVQTVQQPPFYFDTTLLRNGKYTITAIMTFQDGSTQEQDKETEIIN